ncbi:MAG: twin-arginine translocation signal domain-containing protein, partial [bacterium]|nr:twin-arginine translocation signal domain-containing protein [Candidatus Kapabacteria bacterium]
MDRRSFLRNGAIAGATLPILVGGSPMRAFANRLSSSPFARSAHGASDRVLVILRLDGGNDGLNMLVPYHDDEYYKARRRGLTNDISIHPERVTPITWSSSFGLHPALAPLAPLFDEQKVAVVQNVGYE